MQASRSGVFLGYKTLVAVVLGAIAIGWGGAAFLGSKVSKDELSATRAALEAKIQAIEGEVQVHYSVLRNLRLVLVTKGLVGERELDFIRMMAPARRTEPVAPVSPPDASSSGGVRGP